MSLRVLHVLEAAQYGAMRHLTGVVRHVEVEHIVVLPPPGTGRFIDLAAVDQMRASGATLRPVVMRRSPVDLSNLAAIARVRRLIARERPDVVHGHASVGGAVARMAAAGTGAAACYTPHGLIPSRAAMSAERALGVLTARLISLSPSEAALVADRRLVPRDRIVMIPNAIETDPPPGIELRARLGIPRTAPVVGFVGRLSPEKGVDVFVRACAEVARRQSDAHFVVIGDGELEALVTHEIAVAGMADRFHVVRMPSGGAAAMPEFDVFAMPSRYEGAPYAPLEAMRAGVPVVLTDVVGNRDTVEHGVSGLLVPSEDPVALADALFRLVTCHELRHSLGQNGRQRVLSRYNIDEAAAVLGALYRSMASAGDGRENTA